MSYEIMGTVGGYGIKVKLTQEGSGGWRGSYILVDADDRDSGPYDSKTARRTREEAKQEVMDAATAEIDRIKKLATQLG